VAEHYSLLWLVAKNENEVLICIKGVIVLTISWVAEWIDCSSRCGKSRVVFATICFTTTNYRLNRKQGSSSRWGYTFRMCEYVNVNEWLDAGGRTGDGSRGRWGWGEAVSTVDGWLLLEWAGLTDLCSFSSSLLRRSRSSKPGRFFLFFFHFSSCASC
jgi:hypothetical protein